MSTIARRKLDELVFIYEQHPDQCDLFVEGPFDQNLVRWLLSKLQKHSVCVYTIDSVDIPDGEIVKLGRKGNNRERTIYLADFIARHTKTKTTCIVDADFAYLLDEIPVCPALLFTDYSCMEMYLFTEDYIEKFFSLVCRRNEWSTSDIMSQLTNVLQKLFCYRFADEVLNWRMDWLDGCRCMTVNGIKIKFDNDKFVNRYLNKNRRLRNLEEFLDTANRLFNRFVLDVRCQMHGHDFINVLSWYTKASGAKSRQVPIDEVVTCLIMSLDYQRLLAEPLFQNLMKRLNHN